MKWFFIVGLILLVCGILPTMVISYIIFSVLLVRTKPEKWGRECSQPDDPEIAAMFDEAQSFRTAWAHAMKPVTVESDGLRLCGEYYDFGHRRAVIILPGRMESCVYACYFAEPYRRMGYNVLVVDARAHGLSEGRFNTVGFREHRDVLVWGLWLNETAGNEEIVLHGICIGAATAIFAITSPKCPDYFSKIIVEGMFKTFYLSTRNHMIKDHRPLFPFLYEVMLYMAVVMGVNAVTNGPYKRIPKLEKPILFLHGRQDAFSTPDTAEEMFASCHAEKQLVWFEKGAHSRLRINNTEAYDEAVCAFLGEETPMT